MALFGSWGRAAEKAAVRQAMEDAAVVTFESPIGEPHVCTVQMAGQTYYCDENKPNVWFTDPDKTKELKTNTVFSLDKVRHRDHAKRVRAAQSPAPAAATTKSPALPSGTVPVHN